MFSIVDCSLNTVFHDRSRLFLLTYYIEIPLVIQKKRNHNICDVRLDDGAEGVEDYRVEQDRALTIWNLLDNDAIWA